MYTSKLAIYNVPYRFNTLQDLYLSKFPVIQLNSLNRVQVPGMWQDHYFKTFTSTIKPLWVEYLKKWQ